MGIHFVASVMPVETGMLRVVFHIPYTIKVLLHDLACDNRCKAPRKFSPNLPAIISLPVLFIPCPSAASFLVSTLPPLWKDPQS